MTFGQVSEAVSCGGQEEADVLEGMMKDEGGCGQLSYTDVTLLLATL